MEGTEVTEGGFCIVPQTNAVTDSLETLSSMQQQGQLCDVILETECGNQTVAHRNILAACSPYFKAMFVNKLAESNQKVVYLKEIDFDVLEAVVSYAYNRKFSLTKEKALLLLISSDLLQIHPLFVECCNFLETQLQPDNCLSLQAFAKLHNCKQLFKLSTDFASENFEEVVQCEEYLFLPCGQLKELISRDEVRVACEEHVYTAVLQWVYHDLEKRKDEFVDIMSHVRLPFVSLDFLSSKVEQECLVQEEEQCQEFIQEAYLYKSSPEKRPSLKHSPRTKPRKPSGLQEVILAAGGMSKSQPISSVEQYDARTDSWTQITSMEVPRYGLATCIHSGCLYTVGGYNETFGHLNSVECYNIREDKWEMVAPMHCARRYHAVAMLYGLLYVAGGQSPEGIINSVERYDPDSDTWTYVTPMTTQRMYHGLTEVDKLLFAVGGHDGRTRLRSVEYYDPARQQWTLITPMSFPRSVAGVAYLGGSIYVAGGYDGREYLDSVESYDVECEKWTIGHSMTMRRSALGLVAYNECLYACGGFNGGFVSSVECLVRGAEAWEPTVSMQVERVHFGISST